MIFRKKDGFCYSHSLSESEEVKRVARSVKSLAVHGEVCLWILLPLDGCRP